MQWFSAVLRRIAGIERCSKNTCFIFFTCAGQVIVVPSSSALAVYAESYVVLLSLNVTCIVYPLYCPYLCEHAVACSRSYFKGS